MNLGSITFSGAANYLQLDKRLQDAIETAIVGHICHRIKQTRILQCSFLGVSNRESWLLLVNPIRIILDRSSHFECNELLVGFHIYANFVQFLALAASHPNRTSVSK